MALSGTLSTSVCGGHYVLRGDWTATQNVANNKSTVTVTLYLINDWGLDIGSRSGTITINGTAKSITSPAISSRGPHTLGSATVDVPHNSDGTKGFTIAISWNMQATISGYGYQGTLSASKSFTLTPIPRYATSVQSLKTATETSITINWSSDTTINYIWYSTNNGSTWTAVGSVNAKSGSYTISGLSAGTTYSIKTRVRSSSSSLTTDSSALSVTTYQYPYVSAVGTSNLTIGNSQTLTLYNPLGRSVTVYMRFSTASGTLLYSKSGITGTSHSFTPTAVTLYTAIPSAKSGTAIYYCEYDGHRVSTKSGTFTINTSACTPTMGDPTYADTNTTTIGYTGSNQKIIQSKSIVRFTVGSVSTKNSATVSSVKVTVNGNTYTMSASGSTYTGGNAAINASTNVSATVTVTDSRGLTASKSVNIQMLAWSAPTGTVTLSRHLGYYAQTTLKCVAKFSSWSGVTTNNSITIRYTAKHDSTTLSGTLTNNVAATLNCDENYSWTFTITITDLFTTTTITKILGKGSPTMFINTEKQSVGIGTFPTGSKSLEVVSTDGASKHNVAEELEQHEDDIDFLNMEEIGWINGLPTRNIDDFPTNNIYGTYWCNLYDTAITGTLPTTRSGQGLLICKKQQTTLYRQIYIGISGAPVRKFRYYTISTGVWTEWEDWSSEIETVSFTPASGVTNGLFIRKSGRIVTINGYCSGVTFSGANVSTVLGTLSDYYPPYTIRALCAIGANAYSVGTLGYVALDANGSLYARSASAQSNRSVYFSIAYAWTERS